MTRRAVDPRGRTPAAPAAQSIEGSRVAIGPVQLIVLGFSHPEFHGEIVAELERLRESDTVRVIDALAVHKDAEGEIEVAHLSNLSKDEAIELGSKVGALIGLGIEGEEGMAAGAEAGAEAATNGGSVFSEDEAWDVLEEIPNDSAAALILLEHHWAVPLRAAIAGEARLGLRAWTQALGQAPTRLFSTPLPWPARSVIGGAVGTATMTAAYTVEHRWRPSRGPLDYDDSLVPGQIVAAILRPPHVT